MLCVGFYCIIKFPYFILQYAGRDAHPHPFSVSATFHLVPLVSYKAETTGLHGLNFQLSKHLFNVQAVTPDVKVVIFGKTYKIETLQVVNNNYYSYFV